MRRAVFDTGVFVSALISASGAPGRLLLEARSGGLELIVSPLLLVELRTVLERDKFRRYADLITVDEYIKQLRSDAIVVADPDGPARMRCADPDDDYLIALAQSQNAILISGDRHLLDLAGRGAPILAPADLLAACA